MWFYLNIKINYQIIILGTLVYLSIGLRLFWKAAVPVLSHADVALCSKARMF
jgi:hypothetical protein